MVPLAYSPAPPAAATDRLDNTQDASPLLRDALRRKENILIPEIDRLIDRADANTRTRLVLAVW